MVAKDGKVIARRAGVKLVGSVQRFFAGGEQVSVWLNVVRLLATCTDEVVASD